MNEPECKVHRGDAEDAEERREEEKSYIRRLRRFAQIQMHEIRENLRNLRTNLFCIFSPLRPPRLCGEQSVRGIFFSDLRTDFQSHRKPRISSDNGLWLRLRGKPT